MLARAGWKQEKRQESNETRGEGNSSPHLNLEVTTMLLTVDVVFNSYESLKSVMQHADWLVAMHKLAGHLQNFILEGYDCDDISKGLRLHDGIAR